MNKVFVYDPTASDKLSAARGVGRYLQILKENFPDWVFTNNLTIEQFNNDSILINPFFNFLQPPLIRRRITNKQIAVIHDIIPLKYPSHFPAGIRGNINIFLNKLTLKNYDLIITDSEASKLDIVKILQIDEKKVRVTYPCLPKSFTSRHPERSEGSRQSRNTRIDSSVAEPALSKIEGLPQNDTEGRFCLYVGDATWNKNLVNLAKAIKIINVTCVFVGKVFEIPRLASLARNDKRESEDTKFFATWDVFRRRRKGDPLETKNFGVKLSHPWQKELKEFYELIKKDRRFIFLGFVKDYELLKLYQQAAVNVLPSRDEGFGFSYLEAASQGCPSVLSNIPVLKEISDENALFCHPKNPNDIADKIGEVYFNRDLRDELGRKAKKRSLYFSPKKFKKEFAKAIL